MDGLLKKVRGMFAFVIWDDNTKTLYGARDFFGISQCTTQTKMVS